MMMHHEILGGIFILFLVGILLIGLIVWAVIALSRNGRVNLGGMNSQALDIAEERYAKGGDHQGRI